MTAVDLDILAARFQSCTISKSEWTHQVHLRVGAWHVRQFGADEAVRQLRRGIRLLNDQHGTPNSDSQGYHETVTIAYVRLISAYLDRAPKGLSFATAVQGLTESELAARDFLLQFYSRVILESVRARTEWVEPDIAPLWPALRILRANDRYVTPWKNGCGWTAEMAVWPPGATMDTFDWRLSIAGAESDAPFSVFPGVDRTLAILKGRIALAIEGQSPIEMTSNSPPIAFPGDATTSATLIACPLMDFNVMTRRGRFTHKVLRRMLQRTTELTAGAEVTAVLSLHDGLRVTHGSQSEVLSTNDAALIEGPGGAVTLEPSGTGEIFQIEIGRCH